MTPAALAPDLVRMLVESDPSLIDRMTDDVVLRASGEAEWAGTYEGKDAVLAYLLELGVAFPDMDLEVLDTMAGDRRVAVLLRVAIRRDGASVVDESTWTFTLDERGLIADWELNDFDQVAMDAFWALFPRTAA